MTDTPAAGWYADPWTTPTSGGPVLRYWDGAQWTHHLHRPADGYAPVRPTTPDGQPLAGWWHRVGATMLDAIFGAIVSIVVTLPAQISMQRDQQRLNEELQHRIDAGVPNTFSWFMDSYFDQFRHYAWSYLLAAVVVTIPTIAFLRLWGGSPGQLITGLRTRRRDAPGHLSWGRATVRVLAYSGLIALFQVVAFASGSWVVIVVLMLIAGVWSILNPLWAAWDGKKQALHDKIAATNVVRVRP